MLNMNNYGCGCGYNDNMNVMNNQVNTVSQLESCECIDKIREEMMTKIRALEFSITELALYLDTHPEDQKALCLHREYANELRELKDKYQKLYGPLTIYYPCNKWRYLEEPWPWGIRCF